MHHALHGAGRHLAPPDIRRFGFVELTTDEPDGAGETLRRLGFSAVGSHRNRAATLFRQGSIYLLVSADRAGYARQFRTAHGTSVCALSLHVDDSPHTMEFAEAVGAQRYRKSLANELDVNIPALVGPGHLLVYLVDSFAEDVFHHLEFKPASNDEMIGGDAGLQSLDRLTLCVDPEYAESCLNFYRDALDLHEDTGRSPPQVSTSEAPRCLLLQKGDAGIEIPIGNDAAADDSLGEVRMLHFATRDIQASITRLQAAGIEFVEPELESGSNHPSRQASAELDSPLIQCTESPKGTGSELLLSARTVPLLGPVSIQLCQTQTLKSKQDA